MFLKLTLDEKVDLNLDQGHGKERQGEERQEEKRLQ